MDASGEDVVWYQKSSPHSDGVAAGDESASPGRSARSTGDDDSNSHSASVIVVGSTACGKTCLVEAMLYGRFNGEYRETSIAHSGARCSYVDPVESSIAAGSRASAKRRDKSDMKTRRIQRVTVDLEFVDISGADDYASERQVHSRNVDIAIFVYDVTNRKSLDEVRERYRPEMLEATECQESLLGMLPHILVGTKMDLFEKVGREGDHVSERESVQLAGELGCWSVRTSARNSLGIDDLKNYLMSFGVANTPREPSAPSPSRRRLLGTLRSKKCVMQ